jgi:hypothetical protein
VSARHPAWFRAVVVAAALGTGALTTSAAHGTDRPAAARPAKKRPSAHVAKEVVREKEAPEADDAPPPVATPSPSPARAAPPPVSNDLPLREAPGGTADVVTHRTSQPRLVIGGFMAGVGGLATATGIVIAIVGSAWASQDCASLEVDDARGHCEGLQSDGATLRTGGFIAVGAGVAAVVAGAYLMFVSARTTVKQPATHEAFVRTPLWNTKSAVEHVAAAAPGLQLPLLGGSF